MKRISMRGAGIVVAVLLFGSSAARGLDADPYAALKLYDGSWEVKLSGPRGKIDHLENHCVQTGLFFACEQKLNGESSALIVFLPKGKTASGAQEYRTQALLPDASKAGEWGRLVIDGDTWVYTWESNDASKLVHWRNTNHFTGTDRIHFELQNSEDGTAWKTQMSGDEARKK